MCNSSDDDIIIYNIQRNNKTASKLLCCFVWSRARIKPLAVVKLPAIFCHREIWTFNEDERFLTASVHVLRGAWRVPGLHTEFIRGHKIIRRDKSAASPTCLLSAFDRPWSNCPFLGSLPPPLSGHLPIWNDGKQRPDTPYPHLSLWIEFAQ